jgi:hypothetical protein
MSRDRTPGPGHGIDAPDLEDPLTADDIVNHPGRSEDPPDRRAGGNSQATRLVALAAGHFRLLRGEDGRAYATAHDGPAVAFGLRGRDGLRTRLVRLYYASFGQTPGGAALTDALMVLQGQAEMADPEPVALRVAAVGDQAVALDLGRADGRCVIVDGRGWRIEDRSPVLFRRSPLTAPLPTPRRGGSLAPLAGLLNVDERRFRLIIAWLVSCLTPEVPHPILALMGEQGTAKTTAARLVVSLVDPSPAPTRSPPREMRSWAASASASWIVTLDNVSTIPAWLSDTLCKAVTGDGIVERALHTDDDVTVLTFQRCLALTTIDAGRLAGDLAKRLLTVELHRLPHGHRPAAEIEAAYEAARAPVLGALLDITAEVLAVLPVVELAELPRMADFARILAALDRSQGWTTLADYSEVARDANQAVLDSDPVARAVCALVERRPWHGTHDELLAAITPERPDPSWPRTARGLAGRLKRLAPALRDQAGLVIDHESRSRRRLITLRIEQPD